MEKNRSEEINIPEPPISKLVFGSTKFSFIWLALRLYIGWIWIQAGYEKIISPAWTGPSSGKALQGFLLGALEKTNGAHPDVSFWYADLIKNIALHNTQLISYVVAYGEFIVGIAIILGMFTGISAFFGAFMNMNYLFAGTVSVNPIMFLCELFLILAWRTAGWFGVDRYLLPLLGTPWHKGKLFKQSA